MLYTAYKKEEITLLRKIRTLTEHIEWPLKGPFLDVELQRLGLSTLSADSAGQLDVLWHDGDTLGVDCAQVSILEETYEVSFAGFLESHDGRALET
jgi:hypothetical protein